jgi:hypothetical protein
MSSPSWISGTISNASDFHTITTFDGDVQATCINDQVHLATSISNIAAHFIDYACSRLTALKTKSNWELPLDLQANIFSKVNARITMYMSSRSNRFMY